MKCPVCPDVTLLMSEKQGVEIDYCPACRGVWLDRGELDKILERASTTLVPPPVAVPHTRKHNEFEDSDYRGGQRSKPYRKKSWLDEFFD